MKPMWKHELHQAQRPDVAWNPCKGTSPRRRKGQIEKKQHHSNDETHVKTQAPPGAKAGY